ncbi:MAG: histidine phosphotransferase family protein [Caulobacteraceae bacterium]
MPIAAIPPQLLAARLAARLVHDLMGPASGVATALELLAADGAGDPRAEVLQLAVSSSRRLVGDLAFARAAFGGGNGEVQTADIEALARSAFDGLRPTLAWETAPAGVSARAGSAVLILLRIAAGVVGSGGEVRVSGAFRIEARGPRASLRPEVRAGLAGEALGEGLAGQWAPAFYVRSLVAGAGAGFVLAESATAVVFDLAME